MHFHLAHIAPNKIGHGLLGYTEVIETVQWGLRELGHTAEYGLNRLSESATNIIFGVQVLAEDVLQRLPRRTIVYHLEQVRNRNPGDLRPQSRIAAERFRVWDYSDANAATWAELGARRLTIVPIGYSPILERIEKPEVQDIDVLFYGSTSQDRLSAFHYLCCSGLTTMFVCGMYGKPRDELVARAKMIVNISAMERSKVFEIVRVSYLLANKKAVVAHIDPDTFIEPDILSGIMVTSASELVDTCVRLSNDQAAREELERAGHAVIQQRDIKDILRKALAEHAMDSE